MSASSIEMNFSVPFSRRMTMFLLRLLRTNFFDREMTHHVFVSLSGTTRFKEKIFHREFCDCFGVLSSLKWRWRLKLVENKRKRILIQKWLFQIQSSTMVNKNVKRNLNNMV